MVSLSEIKSYLGIETSNTEFDTNLTMFIANAKSLINQYVGYNLESNTFDYYFVGNRKSDIFLPFYQITAATDLVEYELPNSTGTALTTELYKINDNFYLYYANNFNYRYKINLTAGYVTIPSDIKQKAIEIVSYLFRESGLRSGRMSGVAGIDTMSETMQGVTTSYKFKSMFSEIGMYLDKYKMVVV